ncbi:MAG: cupin domain-containing protein [Paramuribaculum sp.]|nr:cupin domain-containing protein [Paramuribaculum sp.]
MKTNYKFGEVCQLRQQVEAEQEKVGFKNIFETENGGVSLVAFKAGQKLDEHLAPAEVMVTVLEGEVEFTMLDNTKTLMAGEFMLMGANVPHSVYATADSMLMLVKLKN